MHKPLELASLSKGALLFFGLFALAGCRQKGGEELRIGVTPGPAEEVLQAAKPELSKAGIILKLVPFTDYIQPDLALASGDLDVNLYQNVPFLEQYNRDHGSHLVSISPVYVPLMAIYPGKTSSLRDLRAGGRIAIPNDPVNQGRALALLQRADLITLGLRHNGNYSLADVEPSAAAPKLVQLDASQLPRSLQDVDLAVINANFALDAGLSPVQDAVYREQADSSYANVLVSELAHKSDSRVQKLSEALRSPAVQAFISNHYKGAIVPAL